MIVSYVQLFCFPHFKLDQMNDVVKEGMHGQVLPVNAPIALHTLVRLRRRATDLPSGPEEPHGSEPTHYPEDRDAK